MRFTLFMMVFMTFNPASVSASDFEDSSTLKAIYDADQAVRSRENLDAGRAPTLQEERDRRIAVMKLIVEGKVRTANDFNHAGIVLHHTSKYRHESGELFSLGTENHLMAFFLFHQAHLLGHEYGLRMMAAAYNYYLRSCGEDASIYGYRFVNQKPVWRPDAGADEIDTLKCGFDPRPYVENSQG